MNTSIQQTQTRQDILDKIERYLNISGNWTVLDFDDLYCDDLAVQDLPVDVEIALVEHPYVDDFCDLTLIRDGSSPNRVQINFGIETETFEELLPILLTIQKIPFYSWELGAESWFTSRLTFSCSIYKISGSQVARFVDDLLTLHKSIYPNFYSHKTNI